MLLWLLLLILESCLWKLVKIWSVIGEIVLFLLLFLAVLVVIVVFYINVVFSVVAVVAVSVTRVHFDITFSERQPLQEYDLFWKNTFNWTGQRQWKKTFRHEIFDERLPLMVAINFEFSLFFFISALFSFLRLSFLDIKVVNLIVYHEQDRFYFTLLYHLYLCQ